jgi:hypothetical protein
VSWLNICRSNSPRYKRARRKVARTFSIDPIRAAEMFFSWLKRHWSFPLGTSQTRTSLSPPRTAASLGGRNQPRRLRPGICGQHGSTRHVLYVHKPCARGLWAAAGTLRKHAPGAQRNLRGPLIVTRPFSVILGTHTRMERSTTFLPGNQDLTGRIEGYRDTPGTSIEPNSRPPDVSQLLECGVTGPKPRHSRGLRPFRPHPDCSSRT